MNLVALIDMRLIVFQQWPHPPRQTSACPIFCIMRSASLTTYMSLRKFRTLILRHRLQFLVHGHFGAHAVHHIAHGQHGVGGEVVACEYIPSLPRAGHPRQRRASRSGPACSCRLVRHRHEVLGLFCRHGMIQRVGRRDRADENQHDQPHALLPVVRAVREADAGASQNQQGSNPERRRLGALRRFVETSCSGSASCTGAAASTRTTNPTRGDSSRDFPIFSA